MTHYEELGVSPTASLEEVRESYRNLVRLLHPDSQTDRQLKAVAEQRMRRINESHAVLSDRDRRRRYDMELAGAAERSAPIIIHAPLAVERNRIPVGSLVWVAAALAGGALMLWLSNHETPSAGDRGASVLPAMPPYRALVAEERATEAIAALRRELRLAQAEREEAVREVRVLREQLNARPAETPVRPAPAPAPAVAEKKLHTPVMPAPAPAAKLFAPPPMEAPSSFSPAPLAVSNPLPEPPPKHKLAGMWVFVTPKTGNKNKALYPPVYIETSIAEENGALHGKYRARYSVSDRAISPDVNFEFSGKATGTWVHLPWKGAGGAKGEVQLKLVSDSSLEVVWSATDLGQSLGLAKGTAVLVRQAQP